MSLSLTWRSRRRPLLADPCRTRHLGADLGQLCQPADVSHCVRESDRPRVLGVSGSWGRSSKTEALRRRCCGLGFSRSALVS